MGQFITPDNKIKKNSQNDLSEAIEIIRNQYFGQYENVKSFLISITQEKYGLSDEGIMYLDFNKLEDDLFACDFFTIPDHKSIHVFKFF